MKTPSSSTLQDETYQTLRQWLSLGRWLPGERLKIKQLAQDMAVGEMPVRTALQRLVAERALANTPNCGVTVPQLTRAQFEDILQMRMLLEGEAAERGARCLGDAERAQLKELCKTMEQAIRDEDVKHYLRVNEDFHVLLYRAAGSPLLLSLIETVWLHVGPISNQLHQDLHVWATMNDCHEDMLQALDRNDPAAVRRAIERDLFSAGQYLKSLCR
ncbi:GntR family transcriptional regulator [Paludibacterium denitrificans]|uniref:FCD domain-containing protein n=1 Tax=Paludibacterium denitrificans TaxID=2675226 RepID=A0A844GBC8_9NEIS|nr:GntR family transcriptional regulator [Paludibacterium denitrificans]MTD33806.1 FCD domain-containing protein [Paludibacterium denitrificans]